MRFASKGYHAFVLKYNTYFTERVTDFNNLPRPNEKSVYPGPLYDLAKAMMIIKENSEKWFIDIEKVSICGFSAGANLAANMGVLWNSKLLKEKFGVSNEIFKPSTLILGYPLTDYNLMNQELKQEKNQFLKEFWGISNRAVFGKENTTEEERWRLSPINYVSSNTPPTFIWHTANDSLVYVSNSIEFASKLTKNKVPYELHIFESGPHGLSLCDETTASEENHINPHCSIWFELAVNWMKKH